MSSLKNHSRLQVTLAVAFSELKRYAVYSKLSLDIKGKEYISDISIYPLEPMDLMNDKIRVLEPPLLIAEILSPTQMKTSDLYEKDVNEWVASQIQLLKSGRVELLDIENLIEELQDVGKSNRRELSNHLKILIAHLLKWQYQLNLLKDKYEGYEGKSWRLTIIEQRFQLMDLLEDIPSLKRELAETIKKSYPKAVLLAVKETNLPQTTFPIECPYTIEQLLNDDFYPN